MNDKEDCVFCNGVGYVEVFNYKTENWDEVLCEDCGGTGLEEDEEGK